MKIPNAPVQQPISGDIPLNWKAYFSQLGHFLSGSPASSESLKVFPSDAAAAAGGVPLWGYYRTGSFVKQRIT